MGGGVPKQFQPIGGKPILAHTMAAFNRAEIVGKIVVTAPAEYVDHAWEIAKANNLDKVRGVVAGGTSRAESIYAALKALPFMGNTGHDVVLIHDGVRPFVSVELIKAVARAASTHGAAIAGVPLSDTIKEVDKKLRVTSTPDRSRYWRVQTPQGFTYDMLMKAYAQGEKDGTLAQATDDSTLVERLGTKVTMVEGSPGNIKITTPEDMVIGEALLQMINPL